MKTFTFFLFMGIFGISYSQEAVINDIMVTTPDRTQIWIINDHTGRMVYSNWQMNPTYNGFKPQVTIVEDLTPYRKKVKKMVKKSKKNKKK